MKPLSAAERKVLVPAVLFGWVIDVNQKGAAVWDKDKCAPFKAFRTLDGLLEKGLMQSLRAYPGCASYRATPLARNYLCNSPGCHRGRLFGSGLDDCDTDVGMCPVCAGTGITLEPRISA